MDKKVVTFEEVKKAYDELVDIITNCKTVTDIKNLRHLGLDIELNYDELNVSDLEDMSQIDVLRVDSYDVLDYIYFINWQSGKPEIWFDIWSEEEQEDIIEDTTINKVKNEIENYYAENIYEVRFNLNPLKIQITAKDQYEAEHKFDEWFELVDESKLKELFAQSLTDTINSRIVDIIEIKN